MASTRQPGKVFLTESKTSKRVDNQVYTGDSSQRFHNRFEAANTKALIRIDDSGVRHSSWLSKNYATAAQGALATSEVYLTSSNLLIPVWGLQTGTTMVWHISVSKTAAGVAAPIWTFRVGAAGDVTDTSRLALTSAQAQTAVASDGILTAMVYVMTPGTTGVLAGSGGSGAVGFGGGGAGASAGFDLTAVGGQYIGLTVTTGVTAAWTVNGLTCFMTN